MTYLPLLTQACEAYDHLQSRMDDITSADVGIHSGVPSLQHWHGYVIRVTNNVPIENVSSGFVIDFKSPLKPTAGFRSAVPRTVNDGKTRNMLERLARIFRSIVAKDTKLAYQYAIEVIHGPFPEAEEALAKSPEIACLYANWVLMGRFPAGEDAIATSRAYTNAYNSEVVSKMGGAELICTDPLNHIYNTK